MTVPNDIRDRSSDWLRRRRRTLLRRRFMIGHVLRGSLIERYLSCGRPGCKCAEGLGHGPKHYLSVSQAGARPHLDYVPKGYHKQVAEYLANYHSIKDVLEEMCAINCELLRRRERL